MSELQLLAISYGFFIALIGGEVLVSRRRADDNYRLGEAVVNVGHGILYQVWDSFTKVLVLVPFLWVSARISWSTLPLDAVWAWVVGLLVYDFLSYWAHRHHHEIHFLWAIHGAHHAAEDFNLAAGLRQATFQNLFKWMWKLPLALVMPLEMFIGITVFDYLYQFLQHTRYVPKLGPIEWVMNTPSHHRVHHGRQEKYLDANYGGILIIWDRLFGTFQVEEEEPDYGLTKPINSLNAVWGNFAIWADLVKATRRAKGFNKVALWFRGPAHLERLAPGVERVTPKHIENAELSRGLIAYVLLSFATIPPLLGVTLLFGAKWSLALRLGIAAYIVVSVVLAGALVEGRRFAAPIELARIVGSALAFSLALGSAWPAVAGGALLLAALPLLRPFGPIPSLAAVPTLDGTPARDAQVAPAAAPPL